MSGRLSLLLPIVLLVASTAGAVEVSLYDELESAVAQGSADKVRSVRQRLIDELAGGAGGSRDARELRYTVAYANWRLGQLLDTEAPGEKKRLLKEAQSQLDVNLRQQPEDAEAHALLGTVIGERINGFFKGIFLGPKASRAHENAFRLAPDNPRVALQRGIGWFFTPKTFGGGLPAAEKEIRRAIDLYSGEETEKAWPNWGRVDALGWLSLVLSAQGRDQEALAVCREALTLSPGHVWLRDEILADLIADR